MEHVLERVRWDPVDSFTEARLTERLRTAQVELRVKVSHFFLSCPIELPMSGTLT